MGETTKTNHVMIPIPSPNYPFSMSMRLGSSPDLRQRPNGSTSATSSSSKENAGSEQINPSASPTNPGNKVDTVQISPDQGKDECENNNKNEIRRWTLLEKIELIAFLWFVECLILSLTVHTFKKQVLLGLVLWKWCVFALVIVGGRILTGWMMRGVDRLIKLKFVRNERVLYFVSGVSNSVRLFVWLGVVLVAWVLLFERAKRSKGATQILNSVMRSLASSLTRILSASLLGGFIWLLKSILMRLLAFNFQGDRFFRRIHATLFHMDIVDVLSNKAKMSLRKNLKNKEDSSALDMKELIKIINGTMPTLEKDDDDNDHKRKARGTADNIFNNFGKPNTKTECIEEKDLSPYFNEKDVKEFLGAFTRVEEYGGTVRITHSELKQWLIAFYDEHKTLARTLKDSKTAIEELNRLVSALVLIVIIIVWLLLMGFLTTKALVFISSQLLLAAFMFGNTLRTVFEAIIFVFVVHPFDVTDRCVIDGVQMIVEEMNLLTTVFLKYDNEKIYYPNSVLATKPIGNFYRSPPVMSDSVEFAVDVSTSVEQIEAIGKEIKEYMKTKTKYWGAEPSPSVVVKDFDDVNKIKMALYFSHTINFQNYGDKSKRRSELVLELKKILEKLHIKYHILPLKLDLSTGGAFPPLTCS